MLSDEHAGFQTSAALSSYILCLALVKSTAVTWALSGVIGGQKESGGFIQCNPQFFFFFFPCLSLKSDFITHWSSWYKREYRFGCSVNDNKYLGWLNINILKEHTAHSAAVSTLHEKQHIRDISETDSSVLKFALIKSVFSRSYLHRFSQSRTLQQRFPTRGVCVYAVGHCRDAEGNMEMCYSSSAD